MLTPTVICCPLRSKGRLMASMMVPASEVAANGCSPVDLQDRELVCAEARNHIALAQAVAQPIADGLEHVISQRMPERVVDLLEAVEVQTQHGHVLALPRRRSCFVQAFAQMKAVGQIGQHVVPCQVGHARFDAPNFGDVLMRGDPTAVGHPALLDRHRPPVAQLGHLCYRPFVRHAFDHVADIFVDGLARHGGRWRCGVP